MAWAFDPVNRGVRWPYENRIEIDQHYGLANCLPCTELSRGAKQVLHMIQQHLKGCIE